MLVIFGSFLGGIGLYDTIFEFAGAGISVPLIGFGGNIATSTIKSIDKEGLIGVLTGPFTASAAGCSAALILGYIAALVAKGKPKRS